MFGGVDGCLETYMAFYCIDLSIVVLGALHGLVLLPVLLSMLGGESMSLSALFDEDGFLWSSRAPGTGRGLLIDDTGSYDQVLITDMPDENGHGNKSNRRREDEHNIPEAGNYHSSSSQANE